MRTTRKQRLTGRENVRLHVFLDEQSQCLPLNWLNVKKVATAFVLWCALERLCYPPGICWTLIAALHCAATLPWLAAGNANPFTSPHHSAALTNTSVFCICLFICLVTCSAANIGDTIFLLQLYCFTSVLAEHSYLRKSQALEKWGP